MTLSPESIDALLLRLLLSQRVNVRTGHLRALRLVLLDLGPDGYSWRSQRSIAEELGISQQAVSKMLDLFLTPAHPAHPERILERVAAESVGVPPERLTLYFCPDLTGIRAPGEKAVIEREPSGYPRIVQAQRPGWLVAS